jgi:mycothiol synthase
MEEQSPWIIRSLAEDQDLPGLLALYTIIEDHDQAGNRMDEATLKQQLASPGHDPGQDRWVACQPESGRIIGYSLAWLLGEMAMLNAAVHPEWRRRGLGSSLLEIAAGRARSSGAKAAMLYTNKRQVPAIKFLTRHGYAAVGQYTEMRASLAGTIPQPQWPDGFCVHSYCEIQNIDQLTEAMNRAYEGLPGHNQASVEQMPTWLGEFNQDGLFLLFDAQGELAGISRVEPSVERTQANGLPTGYIDAPGLYPPYRQEELYRTFLHAGMSWLKAQGMQQVEMESWGDAPEILGMYTREGFSLLRTITTYVRRLN